jgi:hypothetical protein
MTRMSDRRSASGANPSDKFLQSQGRSRLARVVQGGGFTVVIAGALLTSYIPVSGCVIPPSLRVEDDAGTAQDSPPAIMTVAGDRTSLAEPGPFVVEQGSTSSSLFLTLLDTDINDTLYVRLYVDYNAPDRLPSRVRCQADPTGTPMRNATCNLSGLCTSGDVGNSTPRNLSVVVSDRPPLDSGADPQELMAVIGSTPGVSTGRFYFLRCQPPTTTTP